MPILTWFYFRLTFCLICYHTVINNRNVIFEFIYFWIIIFLALLTLFCSDCTWQKDLSACYFSFLVCWYFKFKHVKCYPLTDGSSFNIPHIVRVLTNFYSIICAKAKLFLKWKCPRSWLQKVISDGMALGHFPKIT